MMAENDQKKPTVAELIVEANRQRDEDRTNFEKRIKALEEAHAADQDTIRELTTALLGGAGSKTSIQSGPMSNPKELDDFIQIQADKEAQERAERSK